LLMGSER